MKRSNLAYDYDIDQDEEDLVFLSTQEVQRLSKDLRERSKTMSRDEARYLVSAYYSIQDLRKRFANQERGMEKAGEPHEMTSYMAKQMHRMEKQVQISLDVYSYNHVVGSWLRENKGIGPVIAAGLLAHIDIERAPTVGHIWRYAGLDSTMKWYGKGIADIVRACRQAEDGDWAAMVQLSKSINMRVSNILVNSGLIELDNVVSPEAAKAFLIKKLGKRLDIKAIYHSDNVLREVLPDQADLVAAYAELYEGVKIRWDTVVKALAKRPWNSELKTLCWKIGESFKKVSGEARGKRTPSPYGIIYRQRKAFEVEKNTSGARAEAAAAILASKKLGQNTDAYAWYSGTWVNVPRFNPELEAIVQLRFQELQTTPEWDRLMENAPDQPDLAERRAKAILLDRELEENPRELRPMLPPAHVDARASRYAVKFFLSHLHAAMYKRILRTEPPKPYPIEHLGHVHAIAPFVPIGEDVHDIVDEVGGE